MKQNEFMTNVKGTVIEGDWSHTEYTLKSRGTQYVQLCYKGFLVANVPARFFSKFYANTKALTESPIVLKDNGWAKDSFLKGAITVLGAWKYRGEVYPETYGIGYSPTGKDLTGNGKHYFANNYGHMLCADEICPDAVKLVFAGDTLALGAESFKVTLSGGGSTTYCNLIKEEKAVA
jgi:hypothetical protein